jgi:hypothetical protein
MVALSSSETSVLAGATRRNIPEDAILHYLLAQLISLWQPIFHGQLTLRCQNKSIG